MENFNVAGLASGFDWNAMIDQLMAIERIPQQRLRAEKGTNSSKLDALETLKKKVETLQTSSMALKSASLFNAKSTGLSDETMNIKANATSDAAVGSFQVSVTQLATATRRTGAADAGGNMGDASSVISNLKLATDVAGGTFTVNGQEISVSVSDTLQEVFDAISIATSGVVTASYDNVSDTISLNSSSGQLELGAEGDTSNFLTAMRLEQLEVADGGAGTSKVTSSRALGVVDLSDSIAASGISGPVTGSGMVFINGVGIDFDADSESMTTFMDRVNASAADVTMSYDSAADQFRIVNNKSGAYSMNVIDSGNGLMAAIGLTGAATVGVDLVFSIDGGANQTSRSNTISKDDHGIEGVTVIASEIGSQTVTVSSDTTDLKKKINEFMSAFNDVQDFIGEKTKVEVNDDEVKAGVLAGNRELSSLDTKLRSFAFGAVSELASGDLFRLEHLGIDFISGTSKLEIKDAAKLDAALSNDLSTMEKFFSTATDSFSGRIDDFVGSVLKKGGVMDTITATFKSRNSKIDYQIEEMERRLEFKRSALEASFIAMEAAQSRISNQSSALSALQLPAISRS